MHFILMNGGLGNQIFQYFYYLWLTEQVESQCIVDDSAFFGKNVEHNGFEIEKIFGCKIPKLSEFLPEDVWIFCLEQNSRGIPVCETMLSAGIELTLLQDVGSGDVLFSGTRLLYEKPFVIPMTKNNIYHYGYWIGSQYIERLGKAAWDILKFPNLQGKNNIILGREIQDSRCPVAIHIRRGDMAIRCQVAPPYYYKKAIQYVEKNLDVDRYFLFSDDLSWCREHWRELGLNMIARKVVVVDGNKGCNAYVDMQLMSMCHHRISDHSSFSLLAGILCQYSEHKEIHNWYCRQY